LEQLTNVGGRSAWWLRRKPFMRFEVLRFGTAIASCLKNVIETSLVDFAGEGFQHREFDCASAK
jgi:hypothetical protein